MLGGRRIGADEILQVPEGAPVAPLGSLQLATFTTCVNELASKGYAESERSAAASLVAVSCDDVIVVLTMTPTRRHLIGDLPGSRSGTTILLLDARTQRGHPPLYPAHVEPISFTRCVDVFRVRNYRFTPASVGIFVCESHVYNSAPSSVPLTTCLANSAAS